MKYALSFMFVILYCLKLSQSQEILPPKNIIEDIEEDYKSIKRVSRQDISEHPEMASPPPGMQSMNFESNLRIKREAKGVSGSLPTRKG